ncbi:hypothetical protein MRX96_013604 [Rhipicephalus microplus]
MMETSRNVSVMKSARMHISVGPPTTKAVIRRAPSTNTAMADSAISRGNYLNQHKSATTQSTLSIQRCNTVLG